MFINNVNDRDLCKLIYKASAKLFPQYAGLFNNDLEEFQQQCAVLILPKLKTYDCNKGAISTYIYSSLPLVVAYWAQTSKESKTMMFNDTKVNLDLLLKREKNNDIDYIFVDDIDIRKTLYIKDELLKYKEFPFVIYRDVYDYSFVEIGNLLNLNMQQVIYRYKKELKKLKCKLFS
jgi:hypothetical protein